MERSFRQYMLAGTMLAGGAVFGGATPASALVCPAVGADTNCGIIITLNPGGTATVTATGQGPYDGTEDTLVGIVNNSGSTVTSVHLSSKLSIGGFDGDGLETYNGRPTSGLPSGGATGYEGSISTTGNFNLKG